MNCSGGMSEYAADIDERNNESGADLCECWHEHNRRLLNEFGKLLPIIKGNDNDQTRNNDGSKTPF